jgi:hypothetical protein
MCHCTCPGSPIRVWVFRCSSRGSACGAATVARLYLFDQLNELSQRFRKWSATLSERFGNLAASACVWGASMLQSPMENPLHNLYGPPAWGRGEMADAQVLGTCEATREGSSPSVPTTKRPTLRQEARVSLFVSLLLASQQQCVFLKAKARCITAAGFLSVWAHGPTLPAVNRQYYRRCGVSRPGSGWIGVGPPRLTHATGSGANPHHNARRSPHAPCLCLLIRRLALPSAPPVPGRKPSSMRTRHLYPSQGLQCAPLPRSSSGGLTHL